MPKLKPKCKKCNAVLEVIFEGKNIQYPVFSCTNCGPLSNEWEKWWEVYSNRWKEKECWNNSKDKLSCLVGYFCHKFNEFYGYPYTFSVSSPVPYTVKEFVMARRIIAMFEGDAKDAAMYIKWAFLKKVTTKKIIKSLGFFAVADFINEYKYVKAQSKILRRQTPLPENYIEWCKVECPEIFEKHDFKTWNDLNGLVAFIKTYKTATAEQKVIQEAISRNMLAVKNDEPQFKILGD